MNKEHKTNHSVQSTELVTAFEKFKAWFELEKANGLVDVKFCLGNISSNNATVEKAMYEFNNANKMIAAGIVEDHQEDIYFNSLALKD